MPKVALPHGCYGIELPSGEKYDANSRGIVEVPDRLTAQLKSSTVGRMGVIDPSSPNSFRDIARGERLCPTCSFVGFTWQKRCPRDNTQLEET